MKTQFIHVYYIKYAFETIWMLGQGFSKWPIRSLWIEMCSFPSGHIWTTVRSVQSVLTKTNLPKVLICLCPCLFPYVATSKWAVETFCTSKQMWLWTKCFHLLCASCVFFFFCGCFCVILSRFWSIFHNLLLFAWKPFSVQQFFSSACHIIQLDIECTVCVFFFNFQSLMLDQRFHSSANRMCKVLCSLLWWFEWAL